MSSHDTPMAGSRPRLLVLAEDIKLAHSVFALPFALLAAFIATLGEQRHLTAALLGLVVLCMVLGRTVAMTINRWADRTLDRRNPRTAGRAIPSGRISARYVLATAVICAGGFMLATAGFWLLEGNIWPLVLSPVVLLWLIGYSFTKRFTSLCHLVLGMALGLSPLGATVAVNPGYLSKPTPYLLALMVTCWVAGFDIIYALQDVEFDTQTRTFSLPARLGVEPALWVSRLLHMISVAALVTIAMVNPVLGTGFTVGVAIVVILLLIEHALVWQSGTNHIDTAFFTLNGVISLVLCGLGILDVVMGR